jgi:hypothetical protein
MTKTLPWRRMTLHLSHIFFTEGRTFIFASFRRSYRSLAYGQPQPIVFTPTGHCVKASLHAALRARQTVGA